MRKLASIQVIRNLTPIEGKDKIELARVLDYTVIVQKGLYKVGDKCIYFEPDSMLPPIEKYKFLYDKYYSKKYNRIRVTTMKMGNVYSYGLIMPLEKNYHVGKDLTKLLDVTKYKDEDELIEEVWDSPFKKSFRVQPFPIYLIPKTKEIRLQNLPDLIKDYGDTTVYVSEKLDGCSATYIYTGKKFIVCSRNVIRKNPFSVYWKIARKYKIKKVLKKEYKKHGPIAIQGEIMGPGIQKNKLKLKELDFFIYTLRYIAENRYGNIWEMLKLRDMNGLKLVPLIPMSFYNSALFYSLKKLNELTTDEWIELSKGNSKLNPECQKEGIVVRDVHMKQQNIKGVGDYLSFKIINPDYKC